MGLLLLVEVIIITKKVPDSLSTPAIPHTLYTICNLCVWDLGLNVINSGFYQLLFSMQMKALFTSAGGTTGACYFLAAASL